MYFLCIFPNKLTVFVVFHNFDSNFSLGIVLEIAAHKAIHSHCLSLIFFLSFLVKAVLQTFQQGYGTQLINLLKTSFQLSKKKPWCQYFIQFCYNNPCFPFPNFHSCFKLTFLFHSCFKLTSIFFSFSFPSLPYLFFSDIYSPVYKFLQLFPLSSRAVV